MNKYFFILGRNPTLSLAEIISVFDRKKIQYTIDAFFPEVLILSCNNSLDIASLTSILGGVVKIGVIMDEAGLKGEGVEAEEVFSGNNLIKKYFPQNKRYPRFGISIYDAGGDRQYVVQLEKHLKKLNIFIKKNLQKLGFKTGFLKIKDRYLSSVSVAKNRLITNGVEIVLLSGKNNIWIGKTLSVQEFSSFSFRDYLRPEKDKKSGIMPIKLARTMINLAKLDHNGAIFDPFCGSGTIIQEAVILGYKNIYGSDISTKAIADTTRNIDWLFSNYIHLNRSSYNIKIRETDVRLLTADFPRDSIDAVVTEPYLGPPLYQKPDVVQIQKIQSDLNLLYISAFANFTKILKPDGKIIIIFPVFETEGQLYFLEILDRIKNFNFIQHDFFPKIPRNIIQLYLTKRNTILYGSKDQFFKREILAFTKK